MDPAMLATVLKLTSSVIDLCHTLYKATPPPKKEGDLDDDLNFIKDEFEMMGSFLVDAAHRRGHQKSTHRTWVRQARDLAYDVEDYFKEFVVHLEKPPRSPSKPEQRKSVVDKIRKLKERIKQSNERYKLIKDDDALSCAAKSAADAFQDPHKSFAKTPVTFASKQALLIGRETEKSQIIQIITNGNKSRQIIPIWGMGGIGKTALAKSIFENKDVIRKFQKCAWVTLPHLFSAEEIFRSLLMQFQEADITCKENLRKMELKDLIEESNRLLQERSYLIVLDNISSIAQWKFLIQYLPEAETESRIIVTTREKSVAEHCSVHNIFKLEALTNDAALELFAKTLIEPADFNGRPGMLEQAECILQKSNGLPLAITTICGFLASKPRAASEWKRFNEHFSSELEKNPSLEDIRTVLTSNCEDLPYHLKLCFLYLSIFPEDQKIKRRHLVRRWIAEGYSIGTHNMTAEENGESYFSELISRSIIQTSESKAGSGLSIDYCYVHNLLHEISASKSREEKFSLVLHNSSSICSKDKIRHLGIRRCWKRDEDKLKETVDLSQLRSLTVRGEWQSFLISEQIRMLRVLDLQGTCGLMDHHVEDMTKLLLHLKYLSLRGCGDINYLPSSLGSLWDLETLDVKGTNIILLPATILKLRKLQYLRAGRIPENEQVRDSTGDSETEEDEMATALLKTATKWTMATGGLVASVVQPQFLDDGASRKDAFNYFCRNVFPGLAWGLDMHGVEVPKGMIGNLNCLETLGVVNVAAGTAIIAELGKASQLRKLGVTGLNRENSHQFFSAIAKLLLLQSLSLRSEGKSGLQDCLDSKSSSPPRDLRSLKLYGNLVTLPAWISRLQNLAKLKLRSTRLGEDAIQVLGRLPNLAILRLLCKSVEGKGLRTHFQRGSFPSLLLLHLDKLPDLQSLEFEQDATPNLELLHVENCKNIEKHGCSGLSFLPSLKVVRLNSRHAHDEKFMQSLGTQLARNPNRPILKEN